MKNNDIDNHNGPEQTPPTPDDIKAVEKRRLERLEFEQAYSDLNLRRVLALGHALSRRKG
ncbi:hypothetical protein [Rhizobium sp. RU35A]|uniref:hypothetical protein n=1 Tax=Rhizobium sp. RU35A TaxID=1907414 RepID=UPI00122C8869|nr:hypothetical protein [Rhizobium sp. RU35A]